MRSVTLLVDTICSAQAQTGLGVCARAKHDVQCGGKRIARIIRGMLSVSRCLSNTLLGAPSPCAQPCVAWQHMPQGLPPAHTASHTHHHTQMHSTPQHTTAPPSSTPPARAIRYHTSSPAQPSLPHAHTNTPSATLPTRQPQRTPASVGPSVAPEPAPKLPSRPQHRDDCRQVCTHTHKHHKEPTEAITPTETEKHTDTNK